jgi:hypothetical protein
LFFLDLIVMDLASLVETILAFVFWDCDCEFSIFQLDFHLLQGILRGFRHIPLLTAKELGSWLLSFLLLHPPSDC